VRQVNDGADNRTQLRQSPGALAFDERFEPLANQCRAIQRARQLAGFEQQIFVDVDGRAHSMPL
jgi:hypothetical protein